MAELQICVLGSFEVCWDFHPVAPTAWRHPLAARLLKLLLVRRPTPVPEAEAIALLGGNIAPADLEAAVAQICRVLEPGARVQIDQDLRLQFVPGLLCWIDLDTMLAHYDAGVRATARGEMFPAVLAFQEADALFQGNLMEEMQEPWVLPLRTELRERYTEILERLAEGHAVLARYQDAVGFCHKALLHDPLRESAYQRMMVYYYYLGDMQGVEEAYQVCTETLLGAGRYVSAETVQLWQQLSGSAVFVAPGAVAAPAQDEEDGQGG